MVIVGTAPQRPVIFAFALPDRQVIDAGNAQPHQAMLIEFPVLVAIAAEPIAAVVMPFVGEADRDPVLAERPDLLDQAVVKLAIPLARQKCFDFGAALEKLRAIASAAVTRIGKCDTSRIARVPCVFGHSRLLRGSLVGKRGQRWAAHDVVIVRLFRRGRRLQTISLASMLGPSLDRSGAPSQYNK